MSALPATMRWQMLSRTGRGERVEQVVSRRDDQRWRVDLIKRQPAEVGGAVDVDAGKPPRQRLDAPDDCITRFVGKEPLMSGSGQSRHVGLVRQRTERPHPGHRFLPMPPPEMGPNEAPVQKKRSGCGGPLHCPARPQ